MKSANYSLIQCTYISEQNFLQCIIKIHIWNGNRKFKHYMYVISEHMLQIDVQPGTSVYVTNASSH